MKSKIVPKNKAATMPGYVMINLEVRTSRQG
jgi:hypothetical protein